MDGTLAREIRQAVRSLARSPRFTLIACFTLALAVGANTVVFSAVEGVLLKPLPFRNADRVVGIFSTAPGLGYDQFPLSAGVFFAYKEDVKSFEDMGMYEKLEVTLTGEGDPEIVHAAWMTSSVFSTLGAEPLKGRAPSAAEDLPDGPKVVVIGERLWTRRFGGDPQILGRTVQIDGETREIIGVMPASFTFPAEDSELWLPSGVNPRQADPGAFAWSAVGRVKPGLSAEEVQEQMRPAVARLPERYSGDEAAPLRAFFTSGGFSALVRPFKETVVGDVRTPLWILLGTVAFVFLIACVNLANLFLVRAESLEKELAVRAALGAGRRGLIGHAFAESALVGVLGGLGGLLFAWVGLPVLLRAAPPTLPRLAQIGFDGRVLLFAAGITALSTLLFGVVPMVRHSGPQLLASLKTSGRGASAGRESHHTQRVLVVSQTALALVLMVGSGLLARSFWEIRHLDPGFNANGVLTMRLTLPKVDHPGARETAAFHQQLLERLRGLPGVTAAGAASNLPLGTSGQGTAFEVEGVPIPTGEAAPIFLYKFTTPGYFKAMGIRLVAGRTFVPADHEGDLGHLIINTVLAKRYWSDQDPVGKRIRFANDTTGWYTVVGVVGETRERGLRQPPDAFIYLPMVGRKVDAGWRASSMTYVIKARNPESLAAAVRDRVWQMDRSLPVAALRTMDDILAGSTVRLSFTMLSLGISALIAVVLGVVGLYGVLSYVVTRRTREIGIRMALGAERGAVLRSVVGQGARTTAAGVAFGLLASFGLTRFLTTLLYETTPLDVSVVLAMSGLLFVIALAAAYLPARRASRVDPVAAMWRE